MYFLTRTFFLDSPLHEDRHFDSLLHIHRFLNVLSNKYWFFHFLSYKYWLMHNLYNFDWLLNYSLYKNGFRILLLFYLLNPSQNQHKLFSNVGLLSCFNVCIFDTDFLFDLFDSIFIDLYLRFEYYDKLTKLFDFVFVKFE